MERNINSKHLVTYVSTLICLFTCITTSAQTLEIHHINVGHGDATLIIVRNLVQLEANFGTYAVPVPGDKMTLLPKALDEGVELDATVTKAVLIDFGVGSRQGDKISQYLGQMGVDKLDFVVLSHNHEDHYGGFKSLVEQYYTTVDAAYYRGNTVPAGSTGFRNGFLTVLNNQGIVPTIVDVNNTDILIDTKNGQQIRLTCIASNGYVLRDASPQIVSTSQNDYGSAWLLQYGAFRYFTGGDLSGFQSSTYEIVETPIANKLVTSDGATFTKWDASPLAKGHVCAMKLNHHGSKYSSNAWFLYKLSAKTAFISCGDQHGHPNLETIKDLIGPQDVSDWTLLPPPDNKPTSFAKFFVTALKKNWGDIRDDIGKPGNLGVIGGDIALIVKDTNIATNSSYNVYWNGKRDGTVLGSSTDIKDMRKPNAEGTLSFDCHKVTTASYITNH